MECVKLGIIGIGTMGSLHAQNIMEGKIAPKKNKIPPSGAKWTNQL
jgi:hypothetical protein